MQRLYGIYTSRVQYRYHVIYISEHKNLETKQAIII